jgi:two-component system phosphate regulon response regulator PhoB
VPPTILVVDDEPGWRALLQRALEPEGYHVRTATDGEEALAIAWTNPPALILLDSMLPDMPGIEVCGHLRRDQRTRYVPIIMLTVRQETASKVTALEGGADDYVTKPCDLDELRARVRARLRLQPAPPAEDSSGLRLDPHRRQATLHDRVLPLTRREFDLLELLHRHVRRLVDREDIARDVWGGTCDPQSNVIEVYVGRLRRKLRAAGYHGHIQTRWSAGYILDPNPPPIPDRGLTSG